jgi:predicted dehydrogenase
MAEKIRVACIGTGGIAGVHLKYLQSRSDVEIAGLCDIDAGALERRSKEFGGAAYADFRAMLDEVKPDAVWLCTPPQVREAPLMECARRHIAVMCEKPVARDERSAARVARELSQLDAKVQVGYVFRCMPVIEEQRRACAHDTIHLFQSLYVSPMSFGWGKGAAAWFFDKSVSGGALLDQATHNFDLLRHLFGEAQTVGACAANPLHPKQPGYTIDEVIAVTMRFEKGVAGTHAHTWVGDSWRNELTLIGEKAVYRLDLAAGRLVVSRGKTTENLWGSGAGPGTAAPGFTQDNRPIWDWENEVFLRQVSTGQWNANPCTFDDGVASLRLTLACDRALESREFVTL